MAIWYRYKHAGIWGKAEQVDTGNSLYLLQEYRLALRAGPGVKVWRGRKADEPKGGE